MPKLNFKDLQLFFEPLNTHLMQEKKDDFNKYQIAYLLLFPEKASKNIENLLEDIRDHTDFLGVMLSLPESEVLCRKQKAEKILKKFFKSNKYQKLPLSKKQVWQSVLLEVKPPEKNLEEMPNDGNDSVIGINREEYEVIFCNIRAMEINAKKTFITYSEEEKKEEYLYGPYQFLLKSYRLKQPTLFFHKPSSGVNI